MADRFTGFWEDNHAEGGTMATTIVAESIDALLDRLRVRLENAAPGTHIRIDLIAWEDEPQMSERPISAVIEHVRSEIAGVLPGDDIEAQCQRDVLTWVDSGAVLCRTREPATPDKHLVSYFVIVDPPHGAVLLVNHRKAQLWLPTGGHVEPGEHPRATVRREAAEELGVTARFLNAGRPLLLTSTVTVGLTAGHTDISLWYVLKGNINAELHYDAEEFYEARWFGVDDLNAADPGILHPDMTRFMTKWIAQQCPISAVTSP